MSTFGKAGGGSRREASRAPAPLLTVLSTVAADRHVDLMNVSDRGVRLAAPDLPSEGEDVIFEAECVQAFGRVVWSRDGQCGVAFEAPMATDQVERLRQEADSQEPFAA